MRIKRTVIIPAILTLGMAGSILAGPAAMTVPAAAPVLTASVQTPQMFYHG